MIGKPKLAKPQHNTKEKTTETERKLHERQGSAVLPYEFSDLLWGVAFLAFGRRRLSLLSVVLVVVAFTISVISVLVSISIDLLLPFLLHGLPCTSR